MIVYSATTAEFSRDVLSNRIEQRILDAFRDQLGHGTSPSEVESWKNSMQYMNNLFASGKIPEDAGVAIKYQMPLTSKRVDFILSGRDANHRETKESQPHYRKYLRRNRYFFPIARILQVLHRFLKIHIERFPKCFRQGVQELCSRTLLNIYARNFSDPANPPATIAADQCQPIPFQFRFLHDCFGRNACLILA